MKSLKFEFPYPSYSINSAYYRNGNRKTEYRIWTEQIQKSLLAYKSKISKFQKAFDSKKHCLSVDILFLVPKKVFFTGNNNDGEISLHSKDLTNVEKTLVDAIYTKKYNDRAFKYIGCKDKVLTLCIDDKLNVNVNSKKRPTNSDFLIRVKIKRLDLETLHLKT